MMKRHIGLFLLLARVAFCGSGTAPPDRGLIYSPVGKRDPFKLPQIEVLGRDIASVNPLERFSIEQLQLRGVLQGLSGRRAMLEDPEGKTHIVAEGDLIGREHGTVSRIEKTEMIVTERTFNYLGVENLYEKVISLPQK